MSCHLQVAMEHVVEQWEVPIMPHSSSYGSTEPLLIGPMRAMRFTMVSGGAILTAEAVLRAAAGLEPDPCQVMAWYRGEPIAELGSLTAQELVIRGQGRAVMAFLRAVAEGHRG